MEFKYFFITERIFLITKLYLIIASSCKDNCMQKAVDTVFWSTEGCFLEIL